MDNNSSMKNSLGSLEFANLNDESLRKMQELEKEINTNNGANDIVLMGLKK